MVTKDNDKDEELLILSDDTDSDFKIDEDIIIDDDSNLSDSLISFDDEKVQDTSKDKLIQESDDFSFSFDDSSEKDVTDNLVQNPINESNLDLWSELSFDLDDSETIISDLDSNENETNSLSLDIEWINEDSKTETFSSDIFDSSDKLDSDKKEEVKEEELFNSSEKSESESIDFISSENIEDSSESEIWTMTDILSEAISKAEKRKLLIESDIENREKHISDLKKEINDLENNVW